MPLIKNISNFFLQIKSAFGGGIRAGDFGVQISGEIPEKKPLFVKVTCITLVETCLCIYACICLCLVAQYLLK